MRKTTAIAAALAAIAMLGPAQAAGRAPQRVERCMTYDEHDDSQEAAVRMSGRSAILTHTQHPPICREKAPKERR